MSYSFYHNLPEIARSGGFKLCQDDGDSSQIDWRFIATVDTHKIIKDSDFEKIDECVPFLIRSSISDLFNSKALDPVIGKIYTLSQLSLEYLLFCTRFLDKSVSSLRESLYNYQKQNLELQTIVEERNLKISHLKKYQNRSQHACDENFTCSKCTINFETNSLLEDHINDIHSQQQQQQMKDKDTNLIKAIKLELEVKQLKEKLNLTEKELMNVNIKKDKVCEKCRLNQIKTFNSIGIQINFEEKEKDDKEKEQETLETEHLAKLNDSMRVLMNEQIENFKQQKEIDEKKHKEEIAQLKILLDNAIKSLKEIEFKQNVPSPAPRSSIINESRKSSMLESENLWKVRFQELEKMYEGNQAQMAQSMKDMEQAYAEKMRKLEETLIHMKNQKETVITPTVKPREIVPQILVQSHVPDDESSEEGDDEEENEIIKSDGKVNSIEKIKPEIEQQHMQKSVENLKTKKTFSAQKNLKENLPKKVDYGSTKNAAAIALFNQRMKEINLPKHSRQLSQKEVERIHTELAARRENLKKNCKKFYITRKNLKAKVDKIFSELNRKEEIAETQNTTSIAMDKKYKNVVSNAVHDRPEDREFQQKLERILQKKIDDDKPKKKVLFDLHHKNEDVRIQNEEDSDFNITSFEEDLK